MSTFKLFETDLRVPCDTFQCHERAAYFLGKEDAPKSTLTKVCAKCANELIEDVVNSVAFTSVAPTEAELPFSDEPETIEDVVKVYAQVKSEYEDMTVEKLKLEASRLGHTGYSKLTKSELISLLLGEK